MAEIVIHVTTTGSAGLAAGTGTSDELVTGFIEAVFHDFHASAPATTDSTVAEVGGMARTILTTTNTVTDQTKYPRIALHDTAGTALTFDGTRAQTGRIYVSKRRVSVVLAQCDALTDAAVVTIITSEK